jgi:hypothetical protein
MDCSECRSWHILSRLLLVEKVEKRVFKVDPFRTCRIIPSFPSLSSPAFPNHGKAGEGGERVNGMEEINIKFRRRVDN